MISESLMRNLTTKTLKGLEIQKSDHVRENILLNILDHKPIFTFKITEHLLYGQNLLYVRNLIWL